MASREGPSAAGLRQQYTVAFKFDAVARMDKEGLTVEAAAELFDVPSNTLSKWRGKYSLKQEGHDGSTSSLPGQSTTYLMRLTTSRHLPHSAPHAPQGCVSMCVKRRRGPGVSAEEEAAAEGAPEAVFEARRILYYQPRAVW